MGILIVNINIRTTVLRTLKPDASSRRAYSILELCMIFAIIALSGFLIMPMISSSVNDGNLKTEAKKMQMTIREAQHLAQTKTQTHKVVLDPTGLLYSLQDNNNNEIIRVNLKSGIFINTNSFTIAGPGVLAYDSFGTPSEGGNVVLRNSKSLTETIQVTAGTGLTTVTP
jgi:Tfp pilus assembly protein FimT